MMICWSCEKNAGDGMLCSGCGAVQPPDSCADYFGVFGVPRKFDLDMSDLEQRYKEMTKVLHPDRYARADSRARMASLERTVQLNQAWRTLSQPVARAEYLLSLGGIEIGEGSGNQRADRVASRVTQPVDTALLMEVMEMRESLAEARTSGDSARMATLTTEVQTRHDKEMVQVAAEFAKAQPNLTAIATRLSSVRFYRRFLEEAQVSRESDDGETT
jgi:molecular chaperone HscB